MNPILKNILAIICGLLLGNVVNMTLIELSGKIIPLPEGVDVTTIDGLKASIHLFQPKHFLMPFLAHALGTLVGAFFTALIAVKNQMSLALVIGGIFLLGGTIMVIMLPSPIWFSMLDLIVAYMPMAYFGGKLALRFKK